MSKQNNKLTQIIGYSGARARYKSMEDFKRDLEELKGSFQGANHAVIPELGTGLHYSELYDGTVIVIETEE